MDDQRKDHIDPKRPKLRNRSKHLQTQNMPTDDVENIQNTKKRRDLWLFNKPQFVPWGPERMQQRIQRHRKVTLHWSTLLKWKQDRTEKCSYGLDWLQKGIWYGPQSWIINCLKCTIYHEVIKFLKKTMKTRRVELTAGGRSFDEAKI